MRAKQALGALADDQKIDVPGASAPQRRILAMKQVDRSQATVQVELLAPNATMNADPGAATANAAPNTPGRRTPPGPSGALARGSAREIVTNLTGLTGAATAEWIDTWTGDRTGERIDRPGVYQFNRPDSFGAAPALLIVRADR
jgi:hypothetical protein